MALQKPSMATQVKISQTLGRKWGEKQRSLTPKQAEKLTQRKISHKKTIHPKQSISQKALSKIPRAGWKVK